MQIPELHIQPRVSEGIRTMAKVGHVAKGIVYVLAGTLTTLAAFNLGGQEANKTDVFQFIRDLPGGKILLLLVAAGLACYVVWRLVQAIKDPGHEDASAKRIVKRLGYGWSALLYGGLAFLAAGIALGSSKSQSGSGNTQDSVVSKIMELPFGKILLILIGVGIALFGLYQLYRAFTGSFMKKIKQSEIDPDKQKIYERAGRMGYSARGVMFLIIGYLFYHAVTSAQSTKQADTEGAFNFMQSIPFGNWLLGLVALGLIGYGIFMFVRARYYAIPL